MFGFPSAKRAKQKGGGPIVGQGTGTSDSIDKQAPVGSYIMPADSTAAVGHDGLAKLGLSKKSVPVKVSNGEYEMPPEQVHAVGVQALNQIKDATHQPVAQPAQGPQQFFANGGAISNPLEGVGEYWSKDNAEFESGNPGLMARTGRALNPLTGFGSAVGAMHDAAGQGSIRDMGIAAVQSIPVFGAVRAVAPTLKTAAGLAPSLGKTAIAGSGSVAAGVGADEVQAQSFYQGGPVLDPEELKKKQASFDITNTPSARPGYDMSPTIRGAQAADDSKMQAKAVAPVVRPGYDAMPVVRSAQAAADRNMQAGAMPAATAPGASSANGAVDSAMQSGSVRNAETAQRGLLGEAVTTAAGQQAIQTALTPASQAPTPGNPDRAARMQAQFDQPVTKGGQPTANQPVAAGIPSPKAGGAFVEGLRGAAEAGLGIAAYPASAVYDGVRNAAGYLFDGNTDQLTQYRDGAADLIGAGVDRMSDSAAQLRESAGATVRGALGIEKRAQAASTGQPSAGNPYRGEPFDQWAKSQGATPSASPATPSTSPTAASADKQDNGYRMIGTDAERGLDPGIAVKVGADGVPMFTNDKQAIAGAGGDFVASGFPRARQSTPAGQMVAPAGSRVLASGTNASTEAQQFAQLGSVRNLNNGIGTFSQAESGDAQLAYDRNERAIAERYKMNDISRRGEIGEGGGRVTVVRDSSRPPTIADMLGARLDGRKAETEALRTDAQLGLKRDAREAADSQLNQSVQQQQLLVGNLDMADRQRIQNLYAQYESAAPGDRAALAEQIRVLTGKDQPARYAVAPGGQEYDTTAGALVNRPARVFNSQTGEFSDPAGGGQAAQLEPGTVRNGYKFNGGNPADKNNWSKV